jgi:hypothetical protein
MEDSLLNLGRQFIVKRDKDVSGVSGTGYIAEGVQFHDGQVAVSWFGKHHILEVVRDLDTWLAVHGHGGATTIKWLDQTSTFRISTSSSV